MTTFGDLKSTAEGYLGSAGKDLSKSASDAVGNAVASMLQPKIDTLVSQAKAEVGRAKGKNPNEVTELELAYFFSNLPSAELNSTVADKAEMVNKSLRNTILISAGVIGISIILSGFIRRA